MRKLLRVALATTMLVASLTFTSSAPATIVIEPEGYTPPAIKVAIVRSQTTLDWSERRRTPNRYPHGTKERTLKEYLIGRGYDVTEIVGDRDLLDMSILKQYQVIVLPEVFAISRKASMNLVQYMAEGGGLVELGATPRARPEAANPPGTRNDMREWWWRAYKDNRWEWGPLSQAYMTKMVNDAFTPVYEVRPVAGNSILASATAILNARGYQGTAEQMLLRTPGAGLELTTVTKNNPYYQNLATFHMRDSKLNRQYRGTYSAGSATKYYLGRSVHFYWSINDLLENYSTSLYSIKTASGVPQGEVAGAWIESCIQWAAGVDGTVGATTSAVKVNAKVRAKSSGIKSSIVLRNGSKLITYGNLRLALYDASGRRVHVYSKKKITSPGKTYRFTDNWRHRVRGTYTIKLTYDSGYPATSTVAASVATVTAGHTVMTQ
jgi:hypothetical protein